MVKALLRRTRDINTILPNTKSTPLQLAIEQENLTAMKILLEEGADVERKGNSDLTPLLSSCSCGFLEGVQLLIEHGADTRVCSSDGLSCLMLATKNMHLSVVNYLLDRESCPDCEADKNGFASLHYVVLLNDASIASKLISKGSDVNPQTAYGNCAFWTAMDHRSNIAVKMLLAHGTDALRLKPDGNTAIRVAIERKDIALMKILLNQEFMIEHKCVEGWTPLMTACSSGFLRGMKLLIELGANLNAKTEDQETSVYFAVKNNHKECLKVLLEAGANPNIITTSGVFALSEAIKQQNLEITQILLRYGADKTKIRKNFLISVDNSLSQRGAWLDIVHALLHEHHVTQSVVEPSVKNRHNDKEQKAVMTVVEECIYCPITFEVMKDPVIAADGHTYERRAIEQWLRRKQESPVTRQPISSTLLTPNLAIKHIITQNAINLL
eukprot:g6644.t1